MEEEEPLVGMISPGATAPIAEWISRDGDHLNQLWADKQHVTLIVMSTINTCENCGDHPATEVMLQMNHQEILALIEAMQLADSVHVQMMAALN